MPYKQTPYRDPNRKEGLIGTDLSSLFDSFKLSYENFEYSRKENERSRDYYHNRHYSTEQMDIFRRRNQPPETFNVIKSFADLLLGYYSSVVNAVKITPQQESDTLTARLLHDVVQYTLDYNRFSSQADKMKLEGILTGLMCVYYDVVETGKYDEFNRPILRIRITPIETRNVAIDPLSKEYDYSDARFIHHFEWVSEERIRDVLIKSGKSEKKIDEIIRRMPETYNHLREEDSEFYKEFNEYYFNGYNERYDLFLLVHSCVETSELNKNGEKKRYSVYWIHGEILDKVEITRKELKFPYRVQRIHSTDKVEYYGIFRSVLETQDTINQALARLQLIANSTKVIIEDNAVENPAQFEESINRVNSVIQVKSLNKIRIENQTKDVVELYAIIDKAYDRIKQVLGINDAFLGVGFAGDSGKKVKLLQNASLLALRFLTIRMEEMYRNIGTDLTSLIKETYTATEAIKITDDDTGDRWIKLNQPLMEAKGREDEYGNPVLEPLLIEAEDEKGERLADKEGNIILEPVINRDTEIQFSEVDIEIDSVSYNDDDEANMELFDKVLNGNIGNTLLQTDQMAYLKLGKEAIKNYNVKGSPKMAEIIEESINKMEQQLQQQQQEQQQQQLQQAGNEGQPEINEESNVLDELRGDL